jgi:polyhydroxyalkanoate synthesis regulator phasin
MALTDAELARLELIEDSLNKILINLDKTISKQQFRQLNLLRQTEITDLTARVVQLESQVAVIVNRLNAL